MFLMACGGMSPKRRTVPLYVSEDDGRRFVEYAVVPLPAAPRPAFMAPWSSWQTARLIIYTYNPNDEFNLDYVIAEPNLAGWSAVGQAHFARRIRNPQLIAYQGSYFLFGRSGSFGAPSESGHVICYCSPDGIHWDEGQYIALRTAGVGAYSNTLRVTYGGRERILYQTSHAYHLNQTNILHFWLDAEEVDG